MLKHFHAFPNTSASACTSWDLRIPLLVMVFIRCPINIWTHSDAYSNTGASACASCDIWITWVYDEFQKHTFTILNHSYACWNTRASACTSCDLFELHDCLMKFIKCTLRLLNTSMLSQTQALQHAHLATFELHIFHEFHKGSLRIWKHSHGFKHKRFSMHILRRWNYMFFLWISYMCN